MSYDNHLILAGGGHTHCLMLLRWSKYPELRPKGLITLVNRSASTIYSGMVPGLIAGKYSIREISIDLIGLANQAGVSLVISEVIGLDPLKKILFIKDRSPLTFSILSLDVGSETKTNHFSKKNVNSNLIHPVRPLEGTINWIKDLEDNYFKLNRKKFIIVGSGLAGIEIALALRYRWPDMDIRLKADSGKPKLIFRRLLYLYKIKLISQNEPIDCPTLLCTGSKGPEWLKETGLYVNSLGRVITLKTFQVINYPYIFASGDCGVFMNNYRPPSGVWAVRSSKPLAKNIELYSQELIPMKCNFSIFALQLVGISLSNSKSVALAIWGPFVLGPYQILWKLKEFIDRRFLKKFSQLIAMQASNSYEMEEKKCRGCASKMAAIPLRDSLSRANLDYLSSTPEDSAFIAISLANKSIYQSLDGFPALVSDPCLNGRLTALHSCSDLWASGASVFSAQAVITVPSVSIKLQEFLLSQTLLGIQSALKPQGAKLIGGHTLEERSKNIHNPITFGIQVSMAVNGEIELNRNPWHKDGMQAGDELLLSRKLGSGVIFNAAMYGAADPICLEKVIYEISKSQYYLLESIRKIELEINSFDLVHACTDITGFGLLGHLGEMLEASNLNRSNIGKKALKIKLYAESIPYFDGVINLFKSGFSSSLAPANRSAWRLLDSYKESNKMVELVFDKSSIDRFSRNALLELIVDPQTCGPLALSCSSTLGSKLISTGLWYRIGVVESS